MDERTDSSPAEEDVTSSSQITDIETLVKTSVTTTKTLLDPELLDAIYQEGGNVKRYTQTSLASLHSQLDRLLEQLEGNPTGLLPSQLTCAESRSLITEEQRPDQIR